MLFRKNIPQKVIKKNEREEVLGSEISKMRKNKGIEDTWRLRVGDYRVIIAIEEGQAVINNQEFFVLQILR